MKKIRSTNTIESLAPETKDAIPNNYQAADIINYLDIYCRHSAIYADWCLCTRSKICSSGLSINSIELWIGIGSEIMKADMRGPLSEQASRLVSRVGEGILETGEDKQTNLKFNSKISLTVDRFPYQSGSGRISCFWIDLLWIGSICNGSDRFVVDLIDL